MNEKGGTTRKREEGTRKEVHVPKKKQRGKGKRILRKTVQNKEGKHVLAFTITNIQLPR